jgi:hypothetical protein
MSHVKILFPSITGGESGCFLLVFYLVNTVDTCSRWFYLILFEVFCFICLLIQSRLFRPSSPSFSFVSTFLRFFVVSLIMGWALGRSAHSVFSFHSSRTGPFLFLFNCLPRFLSDAPSDGMSTLMVIPKPMGASDRMLLSRRIVLLDASCGFLSLALEVGFVVKCIPSL